MSQSKSRGVLKISSLLVVIWAIYIAYVGVVFAQFGWQSRDSFDEVKKMYDQVTPDNCHIRQRGDLYLSPDTVTHKPDIKDININPIFPNRTALLHLHNVAMSRAFFWSYILQSRFIRPAINDTYDPGMMYYMLSTIADVSSNVRINASAVYFSPNSSFSSSYRGFFNKTFPLFAPRTFRADDFNDPIHLERISTLNTFIARDLGAVPANSQSYNYTTDFYRINEWFKLWLPDNVGSRHDTKTTYQVEIRYANNTNETFTFHGPPGADEEPGPVKWTRPYFDCGRSNKWIIGAVVPIADIFPRHTQFRHVEYPTYTAISVLEMDFERIDINQCPIGEGNPGPNKFAGTARCKEESSECEPIHGYGFRRGGYQCRCRPGFRLPYVDRRPFLGEIMERSSEEQYRNFFDCEKIGWIQKLPVQWEISPWEVREKYMDQFYNYRNFTYNYNEEPVLTNYPKEYQYLHQRRQEENEVRKDQNRYAYQQRNQQLLQEQQRLFLQQNSAGSNSVFGPQLQPGDTLYPEDEPVLVQQRYLNIDATLRFINSINSRNCKNKTLIRRAQDLMLRGDIGFGAQQQFENEALMAVRLANFISGFLQIVDPLEVFPGKRVPDRQLTEDQMMGETLALVLGDTKIWSAGTYWERNKFPNRTLFAPHAYKKQLNTRKFKLEDLARLNETDQVYLNKPWFKFLKNRWATNYEELEKYYLKIHLRNNETGEFPRKYEQYPTFYRAANVGHGHWTTPYFDCEGKWPKWYIAYAAPFFGWDSLRVNLEFKGVVAVTMDLLQLDVNQCPSDYYEPNAFSDTNKCDKQSSYCVPILGRGFDTGGYKCECRQGYEYPFEDPITYYDGQLMEAEFTNLVMNKETRFDMLKCRLAGASTITSSLALSFTTLLFIYFMKFMNNHGIM